MSDTIHINSSKAYPIRMLGRQFLYDIRANFVDARSISTGGMQSDEMSAVTLASSFEECRSNYISAELYAHAKILVDNNTTTTDYGGRLPNKLMKGIYTQDTESFLRIVKHHGVNFDSWGMYYDSKNSAINAKAVDELPILTQSDFIPALKTCCITATFNTNSVYLYLPVDPRQLFNALVTAENTGCALEYTPGNAPTNQGRIRAFSTTPQRSGIALKG